MTILLNMVDTALADSRADPEERKLLEKFQKAFGISDERFRPYFEVILLKNDRSVFTRAGAARIENRHSSRPKSSKSTTGDMYP